MPGQTLAGVRASGDVGSVPLVPGGFEQRCAKAAVKGLILDI